MLSVACLFARVGESACWADRLRPRAAVHVFEDRGALMAHVRTHPVAAVVLDLRDGAGRPTLGTVRALRAVAPRLPVLARCRLAEPDCRALLDFARAGGTDVLVEGGYEPLLAALHGRSPDGRAHDALVARLLAAGVPAPFAPLLDYLLTHLDAPDAARGAAECLGVSQRALERRLSRAALPSPRTLQSWCRLLVAADRLCGDAVAVERIAHEVGFSSANALRNALQRHAETTPSAVRAAGGLDALVARLCGGDSAPLRVAEGPSVRLARALVDALRERERLLTCLTRAVVARREGCRRGCAASVSASGIVSPRSSRRTSATPGGRTRGRTTFDGRERC